MFYNRENLIQKLKNLDKRLVDALVNANNAEKAS